MPVKRIKNCYRSQWILPKCKEYHIIIIVLFMLHVQLSEELATAKLQLEKRRPERQHEQHQLTTDMLSADAEMQRMQDHMRKVRH